MVLYPVIYQSFFVILCNCWKLKLQSQVFACVGGSAYTASHKLQSKYAHTHKPSPRKTAKTNGYYVGTYKLRLTPMRIRLPLT